MYAFASFENSLPSSGIMHRAYMGNSCFIGNFTGVDNSRIARWPPLRSTRCISPSALSNSWKFLMPNDDVTASKLPSGYVRAVQSSRSKTMFVTPRLLHFSRAMRIIPSEMSQPVMLRGFNIFSMSSARSPVPVAISSTLRGAKGFKDDMARLRHILSMFIDAR